jgi:hypothetical protein
VNRSRPDREEPPGEERMGRPARLGPLLVVLSLVAGCSLPRVDASIRTGGMDIDGDVTAGAGPAVGRTSASRLGLDREAVVQPRIDADWGGLHAWIDGLVVSYPGTGSAEGEITSGGRTLRGGVETRTEADLGYLVGGLVYDVLSTDYLDVGVGVAAGFVTYDLDIEERFGTGGIVFDDWLPLAFPVLRLSTEIGPVRAFAEGGLVQLEYEDARYGFGTFEIAGMYRLFGEAEGLQGYATLGYRHLFLDYDEDIGDGDVELELSMFGPYVGFTLSF